MVGEVNKIVYNMLISGKGVFLPEVGTLYIEHQGARKIADNKLKGPRNVVNFTSQPQAPSLVDEIVSVAGCSVVQAQDIYDRWLQKTRQGAVLTIEGVGVLNDKSFVTEAVFAAAINPKGVKTIIIRRKSNAWIYILCALCVAIALGFFAYIMWGDKINGATKTSTPTEECQVAETQGDAVVAADTVAAAAAVDTAGTPAQNQPQTAAATADSVPHSAASPATHSDYYSYYVVAGVFSTEQNADRAVEMCRKQLPDAACAIIPFKGGKFMVTLYGSDSQDDCAAFMRKNRSVSPELSGMWIYNKK